MCVPFSMFPPSIWRTSRPRYGIRIPFPGDPTCPACCLSSKAAKDPPPPGNDHRPGLNGNPGNPGVGGLQATWHSRTALQPTVRSPRPILGCRPPLPLSCLPPPTPPLLPTCPRRQRGIEAALPRFKPCPGSDTTDGESFGQQQISAGLPPPPNTWHCLNWVQCLIKCSVTLKWAPLGQLGCQNNLPDPMHQCA